MNGFAPFKKKLEEEEEEEIEQREKIFNVFWHPVFFLLILFYFFFLNITLSPSFLFHNNENYWPKMYVTKKHSALFVNTF